MEKSINGKTRKEIIIIGDSMLNNINNRGLSKSKKVEVLNFPGATRKDIIEIIDVVLNQKPESLNVHVGTNEIILLNNTDKIVTNTKQKSPNTEISFYNIIIRKDKKN